MAAPPEHNVTGVDFARPLPPPPGGPILDAHTHLFAADHAPGFFAAADALGVARVMTMTPLPEAQALLDGPFGDRATLINVPPWAPDLPDYTPLYDEQLFMDRLRAFHGLGCRVVKFHQAPGSMSKHGMALGSDRHRRLLAAVAESGGVIMSHIGDPQLWYDGKYADDPQTFGRRKQHYDAWRKLLEEFRGTPWWAAHLGGWPENLPYLQSLLDDFPDLWMDLSATRWMVREVSARRDVAREFAIHNRARLLFGSDQVSGPDRTIDFYASRWWCHRKLWETAHVGTSPIHDADVPGGRVTLRGLALPDDVLDQIYRQNLRRLMAGVGVEV